MSDEMIGGSHACDETEAELELLRELTGCWAENGGDDAEHDAADDTDTEHDATEDADTECDIEERYIRRISELTERLRAAEEERAARERELTCLSLLSEAGFPAELSPAVTATDDMARTVELIRGAVQSQVETELSRRCRTTPPLSGGKAVLTKDELKRIPVAELQRLRDIGVLLG